MLAVREVADEVAEPVVDRDTARRRWETSSMQPVSTLGEIRALDADI